MTIPVQVDLDDHTQGDSWEGIAIGPILVNGAPPLRNVASCRIQFRDSKDVIGYEFNSVPAQGKGTIVIVSASLWTFTIARQVLPLTAGVWSWSFETTDVDGVVLTYYKGTQRVVKDPTHG